MKPRRQLVTVLLLFAMVVGFGQALDTEVAKGVVTSYSTLTKYSTWVSTSYSSFDRVVTLTSFARTTATVLIQDKLSGPYLNIKGIFHYIYEGSSGEVLTVQLKLNLTNLMSIPVEKGKMFVMVSNSEGTVTEEIMAVFWGITVGKTIDLQQGIPVSKTYYHNAIKMNLVRVEINCAGLLTEIPITTYASQQRFTEASARTYATTYTTLSAYTVDEPAFGTVQMMIVLGAVAVIAILGFFFMKLKSLQLKAPPAEKTLQTLGTTQEERQASTLKPSLPVPQPTPPSPARGTRYCIHCGAAIPDIVTFCPKCGKTQN